MLQPLSLLGSVLKHFDPLTAQQVQEPASSLLPPRQQPAKLRRSCQRLGTTYGDFVKENCKVGLQDLVPVSRIAKFRRKPIVSGAFAVPKPETTETRMISALTLNDLVDDGGVLGFWG